MSEATITASTSGQPNTQTTTSTDWTSGLSDELKGFVQNKGFKDPGTAIESYRNLEKLVGAQESLLKLPQKEDDAEGWGKVWNKLGRPEKAENYELAKIFGDKELAGEMETWFHELGVSTKQARSFVEKFKASLDADDASEKEAYTKKVETENNALKKEWGAAYDQNIQAAKKAAQTFGLTDEMVTKLEGALGFPGLMKFMSNIGSKIGEADFVSGNSTSFGRALTPEAAIARMADLKRDKDFVNKYLNGDHAAKAEMERLQRFASGLGA